MSLLTCPDCGKLVRAAWLPEYQRGYVPDRPQKHFRRPGVPCLPKPKQAAS